MKRRISSRATWFVKFAWPLLWCAMLGWLMPHGLSGPHLMRLLYFLLIPILIYKTFWIVWTALVIKRVELDGEYMTVSTLTHSETIPITAVVGAVQREWPKHHPVKLTLRGTGLGKSCVYFIPSVAERDAAETGSFWHQYRLPRRQHPIVDELNQMIMGAGEQAAARRA